MRTRKSNLFAVFVRVEGRRSTFASGGMQLSCVAEGMVIRTSTPTVLNARKITWNFYLRITRKTAWSVVKTADVSCKINTRFKYEQTASLRSGNAVFN